MGVLVVNQVDLNNAARVNTLKSTIQELINKSSSYYPLKFKPQYYFEIPSNPLPPEAGWYIILEDRIPVYVGKANNLNSRFNTTNGSIDNFANQGRKNDDEKNFLKKFAELKIFKILRVCIILKKELCSELGLNPSNLTDVDRGNIEKLINIFRSHFTYK